MYVYHIKQLPGSTRWGLYVDGMLLAKIERGMERETQVLTRMAESYVSGEYLKPAPPIVIQNIPPHMPLHEPRKPGFTPMNGAT
jgi:hypothetical protein